MLIKQSKRYLLRGLGYLSKQAINRIITFQAFVEKMHWLNDGTNESDQTLIVSSASKYSMVNSKSEQYYARQYMEFIYSDLPDVSQPLRVLDLGCGQGRLSLLFAGLFPKAKVIASDLSSEAIASLDVTLSTENIVNVETRCSQISETLAEELPGTADIILMTEVSFYYPEWRLDLPKILSTLKQGGLFISSYRSRYFNILLLARFRRYAAARELLRHTNGRLFGSTSMVFDWNSSREIRTLLEANGFAVEKIRGIGTCSGILGDSHEMFGDPGQLSPSDQTSLMEIEIEMGIDNPEAGRYMLFIARKL